VIGSLAKIENDEIHSVPYRSARYTG